MKNVTCDDEWQTFNHCFDCFLVKIYITRCWVHVLSFAYLLWWESPLLWWKVHHSSHSLFSFSLLLLCLCRFIHTSFWPLLISLRTTLLFQEPPFWSSDCFLTRSLSIFVQTSAHRWRLQLFRRQCTLEWLWEDLMKWD
jgi:hypothetical protein